MWRCPHFRGCYVQASVEMGPEDVYPRCTIATHGLGVSDEIMQSYIAYPSHKITDPLQVIRK